MAGVTGLGLPPGVHVPGLCARSHCMSLSPPGSGSYALSFRALDLHIANPSNPTGVGTIFVSVTLGALGFG